MSYFHGGVPRLKPGDQILPPDATGAESCQRYSRHARHRRIIRTDRVYLTTIFEAAAMFGALRPDDLGRAWVYEVEPIGDVEFDVDYHGPAGQSVQCEAAAIKRVFPLDPELTRSIRVVVFDGKVPA